MRVANVITRMIVGGPQQVSVAAARLYRDRPGDEYLLYSGLQRGAEGSYLDVLATEGVSHHPVPALVREPAPGRDVQALWALYRHFRRARPDVVHARSAKARLLGTVAGRLARVPVVLQTVHGWSFNNEVGRMRRLFVALEKIACRASHCNVFVSEQDLEEGIALGLVAPDALERGTAALIRSGIDLTAMARVPDAERSRLRASLGVADDDLVISLVQRLSAPKTPLVFVAALEAVLPRWPRARAWFVGDGQLRGEVEEAVARAGLAGRVEFLGLRHDIAAILSASDCVVHSSIREGLPRVALETLAVGAPLVATDVGGVGEVARHEENALLVPPEDPAALAAALERVLADPQEAAVRAAGGAAALQPFSQEKMLADQHELYRKLLGERLAVGTP